MSRSRVARVLRLAGAGLVVLALIGLGVIVWTMTRYAGAVDGLTRGVGDTMFLAADGDPWFRLDEQRHDVLLADIAPDLQRAVVAVEDRRFYLHPGIDPIGVMRAAVRDLSPGGRLEGGSTVTQQLARTLFLTNSRTWARKAREASIALMMEFRLTKPQILELYLNRIYLSGGVYGVQTMSEHLFRKPASKVTLSEAALIAGLIRAPSSLSPWSNYEGAISRSHVVLRLMREQGHITKAQEEAARAVRPPVQSYRQARETSSGWAKEYLRQQFRNEFGGDHPPGWTVRTTFDRRVQAAAEQAIAAGMKRLNKPGLEAALVALDPHTGNILAMVGGANYSQSTFNRITRSQRQPGSAFKPFVYAAALSRGFSPISTLSGLTHAAVPGDLDWTPKEANHEPQDVLTLRAALIESSNAAAAALQQRVGTASVLQVARQAGLENLPEVPSLALGSGEVTPLALTAAYAVFPAQGMLSVPRGITAVVDDAGSEVLTPPMMQTAVLSPQVAFQMVSMLSDVVERGTASGVRALGVRGPVAGKTGTTDDYKDAWFVGFSTSVVAAVWVGFDQPAPIGRDAYAARIAVPIWADFMRRAAPALPASAFPVPEGIHGVPLCTVSSAQPVEGCTTYTEYFKDGDEIPSERCPVHQGSMKERTAEAVDTFFRSVGRRLKGIFGRSK